MIKISSKTKGAELTSIEFNNEEKLHNGIDFWQRQSPILFPIVGQLKNGETIIEGNTYKMGQHGFARDMEFEKIDDNSYILKSSEKTFEKYPYNFELHVSYESSEDTVKTIYKVKNIDNKEIIFGLGAHPAYKCDYPSGEYYLEFEKEENDTVKVIMLENGLVSENEIDTTRFFKTKTRFELNKDTFKDDAVILKGLKSNKVTLYKKEEKIFEFDFTGFNYLAFWSKKDANFICIEPWFKTADHINSNGEFKTKNNILKLNPGEEFECNYKVKFF